MTEVIQNQEAAEECNNIRLNSIQSINLATFLGSPIAGAYLMKENYNLLHRRLIGNLIFYGSIAITLGLVILLTLLPDAVVDAIPNYAFPIVSMALIYLLSKNQFGKILEAHKVAGGAFKSKWRAVLTSLISAAAILVVLLVFVWFFHPDSISRNAYNADLDSFLANEQETLLFYNYIETDSKERLLRELDDNILPKWDENLKHARHLVATYRRPDEVKRHAELILKYAELRKSTFLLLKEAIKNQTNDFDEEIEKNHRKIDYIIDEMSEL